MKSNQKKRHSIRSDIKMIQMLELGNNDIKAAVINILKGLKNNMVIMNKQVRNSREMETMKRT